MNGTRRQATPQRPAFSLYNKQFMKNHIEIEFKVTYELPKDWLYVTFFVNLDNFL